ncbi:MAG: glycoside hydrolase family 15 protein, partial [Gemmatimonadaceae bacterium]
MAVSEILSAASVDSGYIRIADHAAIGNLLTVALVGRDGAVDWCCLPELDSPSVFASILDSESGGCFRVAPVVGDAPPVLGEQRYLPHTNVVETIFTIGSARLTVTDFMPLGGPLSQCEMPDTKPEIHRLIRCEGAPIEVGVEWSPRFDYAAASTAIESQGDGFVARSGDEFMSLGGLPEASAHVEPVGNGQAVRARFRLAPGERIAVVTRYASTDTAAVPSETAALLGATCASWHDWAHDRRVRRPWAGEWMELVIRSELALKLLTHPATGAIAAAATTSLPEHIGGERNWDYRFSWLRDSAFTVQALLAVGHRAEAVDFLSWAQKSSMADSHDDWGLRIMYGLRGERVNGERSLDHLSGYRGSRPVRVGNAAGVQRQHDIYGELMAAAYEYLRRGMSLEPELLAFLSRVADMASVAWREPDDGIWEVRNGPHHFVYSKVMVWVALDRAVKLARRGIIDGNMERWTRERDLVRAEVLEKGYDAELGAFVQAYGSKSLDASNLLLPIMEFLPATDPRVQGTIDLTIKHLMREGLVYRYFTEDGLAGGEGAWPVCTFWLVDALALSGRVQEARRYFSELVSRANHVGLFAEEIDPATGEHLGNFPQGFSHIGLINSVLYLARAEGNPAAAARSALGARRDPAGERRVGSGDRRRG